MLRPMAGNTRILAFSGSLREGSFNQKLVNIAAAGARAAGAEVTVLDLRDLPMPVYGGDLEAREGLPENARKFKELLKAHPGLLIASPENNSGMSAALKNAIDWASRPQEGEPSLAAFRDKAAAIMAASPGGLGGLRGLVSLRSVLSNITVLVLPDQKAIPHAAEAFTAGGTLKDASQQDAIEKIGARLATVISKLQAGGDS